MHASEEKFLKFIQDEVQFKIPIYQRLYSWTREHCQKLIEDIKMLLENKSIPIHFMGSIVYIDEKGQRNSSSTKELLVIDGQQRLTTFTLIFIILENILRKGEKDLDIISDYSFADKIKENCLINKYTQLRNKNKLILTKTDNEIFQKLLNTGRDSVSEEDSNLIINYDYLKGEIFSLIKQYKIEIFYENLNKLMIVDIALFHDLDNPQQTFESLNATGKELEEADLIRNFLLMNLSENQQNYIYEKYWFPIENSLKENLTSFFLNFLYMEKGISTNIKNLYKEFKIYFYEDYSREKIEELAIRLFIFSKYYNLIICRFDNTMENDRIIKALKNLNRLGYDSYIPLLMPLINEYKVGHIVEKNENETILRIEKKLNIEDLVSIISAIESFLIRRSVCEIPTNSLNPIFRTFWADVDKENIIESILEKLKSGEWNKRFPDDNEFKERLVNNTLYGKGFAKLILEELEKFDNKEANVAFDSFQNVRL